MGVDPENLKRRAKIQDCFTEGECERVRKCVKECEIVQKHSKTKGNAPPPPAPSKIEKFYL